MEVPRLRRRVDTAALPGVKATTDASLEAFGGGNSASKVADAAGNLVAETGDRMIDREAKEQKARDTIFLQEKQRADELAIQDLDLESSIAETTIEQEIRNLKGNDALTAPNLLNDRWRKETERIKGNARTAEQKDAFERISKARYASLYKTAQGHMAGQIQEYDNQQTAAYVENAVNQSAINYRDDEKAYRSMFLIENALAKKADRAGWSPEVYESELAKVRSSVHVARAKRAMALGDDAWAVAYVKKHAKEIDENGSATIEKAQNQAKQKKTEADDAFQNELYLRAHRDEVSLDELDGLLASGKIKRDLHNQLRSRVLVTNDDPTIPPGEKVPKVFELMRDFSKLNGAEVDIPSMKIESPASLGKWNQEERKKEVAAFRKKVAKLSPYLTKEMEKTFYEETQAAMDEDGLAKAGIVSNLAVFLSTVPPGIAMPIIQKSISMMKKGNSVEDVAKMAEESKTKVQVATNPNRSKYVVGEVYTFGGKPYKVIGYDTDGEPLVEPHGKPQ